MNLSAGRTPALFTVAAAGTVCALGAYTLNCLLRLDVWRLELSIPSLPEELHGTRIAHLSDLHLGRFGTSRRVIQRAIEVTECFDPHITALTGDYFDGPHRCADIQLLEPLRGLGYLVAVLGNHDHVRGPRRLERTLAVLDRLGATVLRNDAGMVRLNGADLWVIGLDDPFTLRSNVDSAWSRIPPGTQPLLLLAHAPVMSRLGNLDGISLVFCGHTHGGQIRVLPSGDTPGKGLLRWLFRENDPCQDPDIHRGHHTFGATHLLISDGLGVSLLPLRFRTRPQVTHLTLVRGEPA